MKKKVSLFVIMALIAIATCVLAINNGRVPLMEDNLQALVDSEVFRKATCYMTFSTIGEGDPFGSYICCAETDENTACSCEFYAYGYLTNKDICILQR